MKILLRFILSVSALIAAVHQVMSSNANLEEIMPILVILGAFLLFVAFPKSTDENKNTD
jgi:hypothetical protein